MDFGYKQSKNGNEGEVTIPAMVKEYWPIIVAIFAFSVTWGVFKNRIENAEARITNVEIEQQKQVSDYNTLNLDVKTRLIRIETILVDNFPGNYE